MNIPDKAVENAVEAFNEAHMDGYGEDPTDAIRDALEAAAPFIAAQAPHLLADYYEEGNSGEGQDIALALREDAQDFAEWLIGRDPQ